MAQPVFVGLAKLGQPNGRAVGEKKPCQVVIVTNGDGHMDGLTVNRGPDGCVLTGCAVAGGEYCDGAYVGLGSGPGEGEADGDGTGAELGSVLAADRDGMAVPVLAVAALAAPGSPRAVRTMTSIIPPASTATPTDTATAIAERKLTSSIRA